MDGRHRLVGDVSDPGARIVPVNDLVHVAHRRDPGAELQELIHPQGLTQGRDRAVQERSVGLGPGEDARPPLDGRLGGITVDREVRRPTQVVVVRPRGIRPVDLDLTRVLTTTI